MKLPTCSHCGKTFQWRDIIRSLRGVWCGLVEPIPCDSCSLSYKVSNKSQHLIIARAIMPYLISIISLSKLPIGYPWQYMTMMVLAFLWFFLSIIISPFLIELKLND